MHPACVKKLEKNLSGKPKLVCLIIRNLYTSPSLSSLTYNDLTHDIIPNDEESDYRKDMRICNLEFSDFRTFPSSEEKRYCVDFVKDESEEPKKSNKKPGPKSRLLLSKIFQNLHCILH